MKFLPVFVVLAVTLVQILLSLCGTDSRFVYALDDPYIHLTLADQLWRTGVYGVNAGVVSAPSSSIIWPFLLGPGVGTAWHVYVPLILNLIFAALSAALLTPILTRICGPKPKIVAAFGILAVFALNLPGLVLTGMEQSAQIFLTLATVLGLMESKTPRWVWLAIFFAPLFRYESALTSFAALAILFHRRHRREAVLCGFAIITALAAFSAFLLTHGLDALPSSTIVKRLRWGADYWTFWQTTQMSALLGSPLAFLLTFGAVVGTIYALFKWNWKDRRWLATSALAGVLVLHLFAGQSVNGEIPRYSLYALAFTGLYGTWLWRVELAKALENPRRKILLAATLLAISYEGAMCSLFYLYPAQRAIYLQQYEMGRFARDFWKKPIGANDIGLVGYQNPHQVLDLVGLSDRKARMARWSPDRDALDRYVRSQPVDLLMVYRGWFYTGNWTPVGELFRPKGLTSLGDPSVLFLTPYPEKATSIRKVLKEWAKTLPEGATFTIYDKKNPMPETLE